MLWTKICRCFTKNTTSNESETEKFNDINEDAPPTFDNNDDEKNNNSANEVNSLEIAEDSKEKEEAKDERNSSEESFEKSQDLMQG